MLTIKNSDCSSTESNDHKPNTLAHQLECSLLVDYRLSLHKYNNNNTGLAQLVDCAIVSRLYDICPEILVNDIRFLIRGWVIRAIQI
jgi:hypothetical protein